MKNRNKKVIALLLVGAMTMGMGVSVSASEKISEEGVTFDSSRKQTVRTGRLDEPCMYSGIQGSPGNQPGM